MKAKVFAFLAAAVAIFASCSKTPALQLNSTDVTLFSGDEFTVTSPNGSNLKFKSRDRFIAAVNETTGKITAMTIGTTVIDVTSDQGTAQVNVTVKAKYHTFTEPCSDFTKTKADLIKMYGNPDSTTDSGISYMYSSGAKVMDIYLFGTNGKLSSSCAMINQDYLLETVKFLGERYIYAGQIDGVYVFANGIDNITKGITMSKVSGYKLYQIIYLPYNDSKASAADPLQLPFELPAEYAE